MDKFRVVLLDADHEYVEMLAAYVNSEESLNTELSGWTGTNGLAESLRSHSAHVFAFHVSFADRLPTLPTGCLPVMLTDGGEEASAEGRCVSMHKFQPIRSLIAGLKELYSRQYACPSGAPASKTTTVAIYSTVGGAGKTTVSVLLAKQLARIGKKTLWISLDGIPVAPLPETDVSRPHAFARLLYLLKTDYRALPGKWPGLVCSDLDSGFDYVPLPEETLDLHEMTREDTFRLISSVAEMGLYDYVLLDLDSAHCERSASALQASARIWWLLTESDLCLRKTAKVLRMRQGPMADAIAAKEADIRFILNGGGRDEPPDLDSFGIPVCGRLSHYDTRGGSSRWHAELAEELLGLFFRLEEGGRSWERTRLSTN
ncbi:AAA family ATPase [Paenibacillus thermoaerophilus]|uniref:AAA family ATPase n=1 Tax=Paenibacillus thermoaerophilus TaxID=1215385 RepID=A0ABW2V3Q5_9BACL|nr:AAA family ATPase [Paenibacillus thermoaerophilus]TMV17143.1 hypothetical protein FE781_08180 [Paenibacillus thermoaerophilus]